MSLKPMPIPSIPEVTACVARAAFPRGNVVMQLHDTLGTIYTDEAFADLFPTHGQPAFAPWRLPLVTVFQFLQGLTDRQAADAVRDRLGRLIRTCSSQESIAHVGDIRKPLADSLIAVPLATRSKLNSNQ